MKFPLITIAAVAALSTPPAVTSLSVVATPGHADVVIGVESSVDAQDFTLDAPNRVVVDLKGVTLAGQVPSYDRVARGGITDVRVSQLRANTLRVVIQLDSVHAYAIQRDAHHLRIEINSNDNHFASWLPKFGNDDQTDQTVASADDAAPADPLVTSTPADATATSHSTTSFDSGTQPSRQPRITVTYQDADIHDVIAAFATFSGRTIVVGRDVTGTVTAEVRNQPWDVAMNAILQGQGLAASVDPASGIITVDSYANILAKQALEPLVTQIIPINYAKADSLVPVITKLLARDCQQVAAASAGNTPASGGASGGSYGGTNNCVTRGAVASNPSTNSIIVTETRSRMADIVSYVHRLDVKTPQVQIKAKIIFVDRTSIEDLGLSYDLGTSQQFFTQLVQRIDPSTAKPIDTNGDGVPDALGGGTPYASNQIFIGGNTLSAIANANNRVTSPALSLVYSAALGRFSLTSFLDALREVQLADLQAEPSIVTVDNKQAQIQVGQDVPVRVIDLSSVGAPGATASTIPRATVSFRPVGIILNVTPHITSNGQIVLDVHAENSNAQLASSDVGYVFNKQSADNRLLVSDGETAVIGGLTVTQVTQDKTGIPLLVDLPVIGKLFGTTNRAEEKRDLLILITPHIVDTDNTADSRGH